MNMQPTTLKGNLLELKPLTSNDFEVLYAVAADPKIWEQHPQPTRYVREVFQKFFDSGIESKGAFLVIDTQTKQVIGSSRYYDFNKEKSQVAIGFTFLATKCWGHTYNKELKRLMLAHAFQFVSSVIFHIGAKNIRSQKAIEKINAQLIERTNSQGHEECVFEIKKQDYL